MPGCEAEKDGSGRSELVDRPADIDVVSPSLGREGEMDARRRGVGGAKEDLDSFFPRPSFEPSEARRERGAPMRRERPLGVDAELGKEPEVGDPPLETDRWEVEAAAEGLRWRREVVEPLPKFSV